MFVAGFGSHCLGSHIRDEGPLSMFNVPVRFSCVLSSYLYYKKKRSSKARHITVNEGTLKIDATKGSHENDAQENYKGPAHVH